MAQFEGIAISFGGVPLKEILFNLDDWLEHELQSILPGETHVFFREGEFQILGREGNMKFTVELKGIK